jgi:hypothetical protein
MSDVDPTAADATPTQPLLAVPPPVPAPTTPMASGGLPYLADHLTLCEEVGRGGFGVVYRAEPGHSGPCCTSPSPANGRSRTPTRLASSWR